MLLWHFITSLRRTIFRSDVGERKLLLMSFHRSVLKWNLFLFVLRYEQQQQQQISSGCNYAAAVVQTSMTGSGISNVTWVRHWVVHFERGTSAFVTCSCKGSEINLSIQFEDFDRRKGGIWTPVMPTFKCNACRIYCDKTAGDRYCSWGRHATTELRMWIKKGGRMYVTVATDPSIDVMVSSFESSMISPCRLSYNPILESNTCNWSNFIKSLHYQHPKTSYSPIQTHCGSFQIRVAMNIFTQEVLYSINLYISASKAHFLDSATRQQRNFRRQHKMESLLVRRWLRRSKRAGRTLHTEWQTAVKT